MLSCKSFEAILVSSLYGQYQAYVKLPHKTQNTQKKHQRKPHTHHGTILVVTLQVYLG